MRHPLGQKPEDPDHFPRQIIVRDPVAQVPDQRNACPAGGESTEQVGLQGVGMDKVWLDPVNVSAQRANETHRAGDFPELQQAQRPDLVLSGFDDIGSQRHQVGFNSRVAQLVKERSFAEHDHDRHIPRGVQVVREVQQGDFPAA